MEVRGLVRDSEIYHNSAKSVQIHSGYDYLRGRKVVIKTLRCANLAEVNATFEEGLTHIKLEHPNICRIYDCFLEEDSGEYKVIFVIEFQETDLYKEIESRRKAERYWTEKELMEMIKTLIRVFAFLQSKGACHRDIKPQNIFISASGVLKVGDFGSASRNLDEFEQEYTLVGTPLYLSPSLRNEYLKKIIGFKVSRVTHNVFKSDVFSLGLTFLHMARLKPPTELASLDDLEVKRQQVLQQIQYSRGLTELIAKALELEETDRPDFLQLEQLMTGNRDTRACSNIDVQPLITSLNSKLKEESCNLSDCRNFFTSLFSAVSLSFQCSFRCLNCSREQSLAAGVYLDCGKAHGFCSSICARQYSSKTCPHCHKCQVKQYSVPERCFFCAETLGQGESMSLPCSPMKKLCSRTCFESNSTDGLCPLCGARHGNSARCVVCGSPGTAIFCVHAYCGECIKARVLRCLEFSPQRVDCSLCETPVPRNKLTELLAYNTHK